MLHFNPSSVLNAGRVIENKLKLNNTKKLIKKISILLKNHYQSIKNSKTTQKPFNFSAIIHYIY